MDAAVPVFSSFIISFHGFDMVFLLKCTKKLLEKYKENIKATGINVKSHWSKICIIQEIPF